MCAAASCVCPAMRIRAAAHMAHVRHACPCSCMQARRAEEGVRAANARLRRARCGQQDWHHLSGSLAGAQRGEEQRRSAQLLHKVLCRAGWHVVTFAGRAFARPTACWLPPMMAQRQLTRRAAEDRGQQQHSAQYGIVTAHLQPKGHVHVMPCHVPCQACAVGKHEAGVTAGRMRPMGRNPGGWRSIACMNFLRYAVRARQLQRQQVVWWQT